MECDLVDIWRVRNPDSKKFTWRQKNPIIQRRLDYWLISDSLQDDVAKIDIVTAIKTDHSAVFLEIDSLADHPRGPFFQGLHENFPLWLKEISFCDDLRVKWDWIKYKIRQESMTYSKLKAKERKAKMKTIEDRLKFCEEKIADAPTPESLTNLESVRANPLPCHGMNKVKETPNIF